MYPAIPRLFLEEFVECFPHIVSINLLSSTASGERDSIVGLEVVAEVGLELVLHVLCRGLAALIILARIKEAAVLAAVNVS